MTKLDEIRAFARSLPGGLTADWKETNHYELGTPEEPWWLDLDDLRWLSESPSQPLQMQCETTVGLRLGLVFDAAARYRPDVEALMLVADAAAELMAMGLAASRSRDEHIVRLRLKLALGAVLGANDDETG